MPERHDRWSGTRGTATLLRSPAGKRFPRLLAGALGTALWVGGAAAEELHRDGGYDPAGRRDPFVSLVRDGKLIDVGPSMTRAELAKPVLYGVLWDAGGKSIALINDLEAKVGDTIGGFRIKDIRQDAVIIENLTTGEQSTLTIAFEPGPGGALAGPEKGGGPR